MRFQVRQLSDDSEEGRQLTELLFSVYVDEGFTDRESAKTAFRVEQVRKRGDVFVAWADGAVLGIVVLARPDSQFRQIANNGEAEIHLLSVRGSARGNGIGAALVRACEEQAVSLGFRAIVLSTQPSMRAAHSLYERLGYERSPSRNWSNPKGKSYLAFEKNLTGHRPQ